MLAELIFLLQAGAQEISNPELQDMFYDLQRSKPEYSGYWWTLGIGLGSGTLAQIMLLLRVANGDLLKWERRYLILRFTRAILVGLISSLAGGIMYIEQMVTPSEGRVFLAQLAAGLAGWGFLEMFMQFGPRKKGDKESE